MNDFNKPRSEIEHIIDEWVFSERDRKLLKRRLLDGILIFPLAEEFDLSEKQVRNILYKYMKKLDKMLK